MSRTETLGFRVDGIVHHPGAPAPAIPPGANTSLLRRVAAGLAHNVNNALTGVVASLELALRDAPPGSAQHARLSEALCGALRLAERVRRLVAFARRPEARHTGAVCLRRAAEEAARRAARTYPALAIAVQGEVGSCVVRASEPLLHLVLEQLAGNAAEAMPHGGALTFRVCDEGPRRYLAVADTGPGLGADVRPRLFEPFFTTKSFGHLGVGLALCRDALEAMGGAIHLTSSEGQGTTATLSFPPHDAADAPPAAAHTFTI